MTRHLLWYSSSLFNSWWWDHTGINRVINIAVQPGWGMPCSRLRLRAYDQFLWQQYNHTCSGIVSPGHSLQMRSSPQYCNTAVLDLQSLHYWLAILKQGCSWSCLRCTSVYLIILGLTEVCQYWAWDCFSLNRLKSFLLIFSKIDIFLSQSL